jgi:hypothetical protein
MDILSAFFAAASGAMLFSLVSETSAAETSGGSYMIPSNGQITCGEFLSDSPRSQATDTEWVLGYISGRNRVSASGRMAGSSFKAPESVMAWLQDYCRTHALDHLADAADGLRDEFLRRESMRSSQAK